MINRISVIILAIAFVSSAFCDQPNIVILATGGTFAGVSQSPNKAQYQAGSLKIQELSSKNPYIHQLANITTEQISNLPSQDMDESTWLSLSKRVNELLARDDVDGIVVTHGTDTMEETAYFLNLTTKSIKPVVLTGAWYPSTHMNADGIGNLYSAVTAASDKASRGKGVLIVMDQEIFGARGATKNVVNQRRFFMPHGGLMGHVRNGRAVFQSQSGKKHTHQAEFDITSLSQLPKVGITYHYAGVRDDAVINLVNNYYNGIVTAGVGNGNLSSQSIKQLHQASHNNVLIVRSSRTSAGRTDSDVEISDTEYGFISSGSLNPQKSRILLMLALTKTQNRQEIQRLFDTY